jgi:hypothetical protein
MYIEDKVKGEQICRGNYILNVALYLWLRNLLRASFLALRILSWILEF